MSSLLEYLIKAGEVTPDVEQKGQFINPYLNGIKEYQAQAMPGAGLTPNRKIHPAQDAMFLLRDFDRKILNDKNSRDYWIKRKTGTQYHELDHILANRANDRDVHPIWDLLGDNQARVLLNQLRQTIDKNKDKLLKKYRSLEQSSYIHFPNTASLSELLAELNSIEDTHKVDLLKDELIKGAFSNRNMKDAYKASTGYRRTRMDANDPSPYTMDKGFWTHLLDSFRD